MLHLSFLDVTLASKDGNSTQLCEQGSGCGHRILRGVWEGFSLPHLHGWQGHPSLLHHPRAPKNPTQYPLQPLALKLRLLDLKLLNLQLLDLHLLDFQLLDLQLMDLVP